jgi:hypothetical protein
MALNFDLVLASLSKADAKAVGCVSPAAVSPARSPAEHLLMMTRRANAEQQKSAVLREEYEHDLQAFQTMHSRFGGLTRVLEMQNRQMQYWQSIRNAGLSSSAISAMEMRAVAAELAYQRRLAGPEGIDAFIDGLHLQQLPDETAHPDDTDAEDAETEGGEPDAETDAEDAETEGGEPDTETDAEDAELIVGGDLSCFVCGRGSHDPSQSFFSVMPDDDVMCRACLEADPMMPTVTGGW